MTIFATEEALKAGRPFGGYRCILADPPWREEMRSAKGEAKSPQAHYRCMTLAEIFAFGATVRHIAAMDCLLLMWTTAPMLAEAIHLLDPWGFQFKSCAAWAKESKRSGDLDTDHPDHKFTFGTGYIFRSAAEFLIAATKGAPAWRRAEGSRSVRNLIYHPVREHSRKPDAQYEIAERLMPGPYIELFSRASRTGWDVFGDQVNHFEGAEA